MIASIISIVISIVLAMFFIIFVIVYYARLNRALKEEIKQIEIKDSEKVVSEESKGELKDKLAQISEIIAETEQFIDQTVKKKMSILESQLDSSEVETEMIEKGGKEYRMLTVGLKSATPKTPEELENDMKTLQIALDKLEFLGELKSKRDVGTGIYYDKMSRKFIEIIKKYNLDTLTAIPLPRFKYHVFSELKSIKDSDVILILKVMKETNLIRDLVEINPSLYFIIIKNVLLDFSMPEKVVLSYLYEEKDRSIENLLKFTEWDYTYAKKVINRLVDKRIVVVDKDDIIAPMYGNIEDMKNWDNIINLKIREEEKREDERIKKQEELRAKLEPKKETMKSKASIDKKVSDKTEMVEEEEEVKAIKFGKKPQVKKLPKIDDKTADFSEAEVEDQIDDEREGEKDAVSSLILSFHEKFSIVNGSFVQYEKLKDFILRDLPTVTDETIKATIEDLKVLKLIHIEIIIDEHPFYAFKPIKFTKLEKEFIAKAINSKPLSKKEYLELLKWEEDRLLKVMKKLQEKGILRIKADKIIIPGVLQIEDM
jgi:hypothetical protein